MARTTIESTHREDQTQLVRLESWLHNNFCNNASSVLDEPDLQGLVQECHVQRTNMLFNTLKLFTGQGQTRLQEFEQLYKLLCKLAKHVTISRRLIEAAVLLPQDLGQDFTVKTIPSFSLQKLPLSSKEANVESTVGRMFSSSEEQNKFLVRLRSVWDTHELSTRLQEQITTKTRVHAELLLVNYFDKYGCTFLDGNDKYIGCSKPACYLCYAYIVSHPGRYALPASHQKLYVGWRVPDIYLHEPQSARRSKMQEDILLRMIEWIRRDLKTDMESREPRRPYHADSTVGLTSISDSLVHETMLLASSLSLHNDRSHSK